MSFSSDVKNELCWILNKKEQYDYAQGYGMLLFSRCFSLRDRKVNIENGNAARLMAGYAASLAGVIPELSVKLHAGRSSGESYTMTIPGTDQRKQLLSAFNHNPDEEIHLINRDNMKNQNEVSAFLRGVFLSSGVVADPEKEYHLEINVSTKERADDLADYIKSTGLGFEPSVTERNGSCIVYFKDSNQIEDFLTLIGASKASMELMQVKMYKEARNDINRRTNFETANLDRTYSASVKQVLAIAIISDTMGLDKLSDELREVCELRLNNESMSLRDMSKALGISRSGVNHRINKIISIAEECSGGRKIEEIIALRNSEESL